MGLPAAPGRGLLSWRWRFLSPASARLTHSPRRPAHLQATAEAAHGGQAFASALAEAFASGGAFATAYAEALAHAFSPDTAPLCAALAEASATAVARGQGAAAQAAAHAQALAACH